MPIHGFFPRLDDSFNQLKYVSSYRIYPLHPEGLA